jgi:hypothetical protein
VIGLVVAVSLVGLTRLATGLRLARDPLAGPLIPMRTRFTLAEFLCGVAIVGVTLGAIRLVAPRDWGYFAWFTMPKEVLNFFWIWTYTTFIAVPTVLLLVYPRKLLLAAGYFFLTITLLVLQQRWEFIGSMPLSGWRFYWLLESLGMTQVVAHVAIIHVALTWLGYDLTCSACGAESANHRRRR